jgi:multimeric flavodoxin WrbA
MKLLALTCGRKMANCEILTKEAMMGAEELGADVELIRTQDLDIRTCKICWPAPCMMKGPKGCIIKDDAAFLSDKILNCDGLIISAPVYTLTPPGQLLAIRDRIMGPRVDVASFAEVKKMKGTDDRFQQKMFIDDRIFNRRVGAFICVGGAPKKDWVSMGLPLMHTFTFSMQIEIIDQLQVTGIAEDGAVALNTNYLKRAQKLGKNIAKAMQTPAGKTKYLGEADSTCPVCHNNLMVLGNNRDIECAVCGIHGQAKITGNKMSVLFSKSEQQKSRLKMEGKRIHHFEIMDVAMALEPFKDQIPAKLEKYRKYGTPSLPPKR